MSQWVNLKRIGPGIVLAATGIGASDFFGATWAGTDLGTGVLWAVALGAALKFFLTEGLARYQIATGQTLTQAWLTRLPRTARLLLVAYFLLWSVFVSALLMDACGLAASYVFGFIPGVSEHGNLLAAAHGIFGLLLISLGQYSGFERIMRGLVGLTFLTVLYCAWATPAPVLSPPRFFPGQSAAIIALMTGIGGTVTMLSYGYWIREKHYHGRADVRLMRLDCGTGYVISGVFNVLMVYLAAATLGRAGLQLGSEKAARSAFATMGDLISTGPEGFYVFAAAFWCVVFASLLGVWQSVPFIFADGARIMTAGKHTGPVILTATTESSDHLDARDPAGGPDAAGRNQKQTKSDEESRTRRLLVGYRVAMVVAAMVLLYFPTPALFFLYAMTSALFLPFLSASLLWLNTRPELGELRSGRLINTALGAGLALFTWLAYDEISTRLAKIW